jgi:hypothetical protein
MATVLALPDDIGTLPTIAVDSLVLTDFFFCFFMEKEPQMLSQECNETSLALAGSSHCLSRQEYEPDFSKGIKMKFERNGPKPTVLDLLCTMAQAIFLGGIALGSIFGFIFMQK